MATTVLHIDVEKAVDEMTDRFILGYVDFDDQDPDDVAEREKMKTGLKRLFDIGMGLGKHKGFEAASEIIRTHPTDDPQPFLDARMESVRDLLQTHGVIFDEQGGFEPESR